MKRSATVLAAAVMILPVSACSPPEGGAARTAEPPPRGATVLDHAATLPPLAAEGGVLAIPLAGAEPYPWRPIREGVTAKPGGSLTVAYTRTRGQPAGAAIVIRPGDLAGLDSLTLSVRGTRSQTIFLNLTQADGSVWTSPPIRLAEGERREVRVKRDDITLDPYQNKGAGAGPAFDPAGVYMLTLLDIGGFMAFTEPECEWTVESMKAVLR